MRKQNKIVSEEVKDILRDLELKIDSLKNNNLDFNFEVRWIPLTYSESKNVFKRRKRKWSERY